jgi:methionyl-tRNA formyltransferase
MDADFLFAVSWRWLIKTRPGQKLVVFHDSILPRYRGFAPLVAALVNGDSRLGVTALLASSEYDSGPIIARETIGIKYPLKIDDAIEMLTPLYRRLALKVMGRVLRTKLTGKRQDESRATYSLWRDDADYFIDWNRSAPDIRRFVHAVGFPYLGAATIAAGRVHRILDCTPVGDVRVENRTPGKVIFQREGRPVVVCGKGLLRIDEMVDTRRGRPALPLKKFRTRFFRPSDFCG